MTSTALPRLFLRNKRFRHGFKVEVTGETSRSWVSGPKWAPIRYAKRDHDVISEEDYNAILWRDHHQYRIGQLVGNRLDPAVLKQIAELIGYKEEGSR